MRNVLITRQAWLIPSDTRSQTTIDDHSAIQRLACRLDTVCAIQSGLPPSLLSHALSSPQHPNRRTSQTAFSTGHTDSRGPSPTSSQTSYLPCKLAKHHHFDHSLLHILHCGTLHVVLRHLKLQHTPMSAYRLADLIIKETLRIT